MVATPHVACYVREYEDYAIPILMKNMRCFLDGRIDDMQNLIRGAPAATASRPSPKEHR